MYIIKILKRRDAASVIVAIVLGFILLNILQIVTADLSTFLAGIDIVAENPWREGVVRPLIASALNIIALEAFLRVVVHVRPYFVRRVKKSK